jgi:hypothetical protein
MPVTMLKIIQPKLQMSAAVVYLFFSVNISGAEKTGGVLENYSKSMSG